MTVGVGGRENVWEGYGESELLVAHSIILSEGPFPCLFPERCGLWDPRRNLKNTHLGVIHTLPLSTSTSYMFDTQPSCMPTNVSSCGRLFIRHALPNHKQVTNLTRAQRSWRTRLWHAAASRPSVSTVGVLSEREGHMYCGDSRALLRIR